MAKIADYSKVESLTEDNIFLLDGSSGTKTILASKLGKALLDLMSTEDIVGNLHIEDLEPVSEVQPEDVLLLGTGDGNHRITIDDAIDKFRDATTSTSSDVKRRNFWRGKNLGSAVTDEQWESIGNGTFKGLFLGDYWFIGGRIWRIVDFNYWYDKGDTGRYCYTPHVVIMPDRALLKATMNDTATSSGAYVGSKMYTTNFANVNSIVFGDFGESHILNHREYFQNATTGNVATAGAFYDSRIELPNEVMIYGHYTMTAAPSASDMGVNRITLDASQLAGFQASVHLINPHSELNWLRDVANSGDFVTMNAAGNASHASANNTTVGVRPVFGLCKQNL